MWWVLVFPGATQRDPTLNNFGPLLRVSPLFPNTAIIFITLRLDYPAVFTNYLLPQNQRSSKQPRSAPAAC